jgi:hypothetical protein
VFNSGFSSDNEDVDMQDINCYESDSEENELVPITSTPAPPLVGIELNPGPRTVAKKIADAAIAIATGRGTSINHKYKDKIKKYESAMLNNRPIHEMGKIAPEQFAPSNTNLTLKPYVRFYPARHGTKNGLGVHACQRVIGLFAYTGAAPSFSATSAVNALAVDPSNLGLPLNIFALMFIRFRFTKLKWIFRSALSTSAAGAIVFGYSSDGTTTAATITTATVGSMENSIETNAWASTELDCTVEKEALLYNSNQGSDAGAARLQQQGYFMAAGLINGAANGTVVGDIWLEYSCEFFELGDVANLKFYRAPREPPNMVAYSPQLHSDRKDMEVVVEPLSHHSNLTSSGLYCGKDPVQPPPSITPSSVREPTTGWYGMRAGT